MRKANELPSGLVKTVAMELERDERVVWLGQPLPWLYAKRSLPAFLFGILWTIFVANFAYHILREDGDWGNLIAFSALGVPFFLIGCIALLSPVLMIRKAKRTAYAVTNQRALIFDAGWFSGHTIRSFRPEQLQDLRRVQKPNGSGDLILDRQWSRDSDGSPQSTDYGFLAIRDPKMVEGLIRDLTQVSSTL